MSRDDIREIARIVGTDSAYRHFVRRINKEFDLADEKRNASVYVLYQNDIADKTVGFAVIGHSPAKMKIWEKTFKEEGWMEADFEMRNPAFELMYMYVRPEARGRGLARELFRRVVAFTKEYKVKGIYAYVGERDDSALNFYKKTGGRIIKDLSDEGMSNAFFEWKL